jgi:hypothetical protein
VQTLLRQVLGLSSDTMHTTAITFVMASPQAKVMDRGVRDLVEEGLPALPTSSGTGKKDC